MSRTVQPTGWIAPKGYANAILARGEMLFIAGQVGWDDQGHFPSDDFVDQTRQALQNILAILQAAGAQAEHLVRLTWYVRDKRDYLAALPAVGRAYREVLGRHFPAMTLVEVASLLEDRAKVEIEATAVIPEHETTGS